MAVYPKTSAGSVETEDDFDEIQQAGMSLRRLSRPPTVPIWLAQKLRRRARPKKLAQWTRGAVTPRRQIPDGDVEGN